MLTVPPNLIFKVLGRVSSSKASLCLRCTKFSEVFGREGLFQGTRCLQSHFILYPLGHGQILDGIFRREEFCTGAPCLHSDVMWYILGRYLLLPVLTTNTVGDARCMGRCEFLWKYRRGIRSWTSSGTKRLFYALPLCDLAISTLCVDVAAASGSCTKRELSHGGRAR